MVAGYATLREIHETWTMADLMDANDVLTAVERAQVQARAQDKR